LVKNQKSKYYKIQNKSQFSRILRDPDEVHLENLHAGQNPKFGFGIWDLFGSIGSIGIWDF